MNKDITCIICPLGCKIHIEEENNDFIWSIIKNENTNGGL